MKKMSLAVAAVAALMLLPSAPGLANDGNVDNAARHTQREADRLAGQAVDTFEQAARYLKDSMQRNRVDILKAVDRATYVPDKDKK